jgi:RNA polymerase sigma-70 factor, ECF subfamily
VPKPPEIGEQDRSAKYIQLLTANQPRLYAYIATIMLGDAAAADVLQETNIQLWTHAHEFDFNRPFLPWAFGFARPQVMAFRKSCNRSRLVFDDETLRFIDDKVALSATEIDSRLPALQKCLKKLNAQQAELIRARYMAKTPVNALAERLNETAHNISSQLHRIRKILARCIESTLSAEEH